jgi:hypothetical protein
VLFDPKTGKPKDNAVVEIDIAFADAVTAARETDAGKTSDAGIVFVIGHIGHISALAHAADRLDVALARFESGSPRLGQPARRKLHGFRVVLFLLSQTDELDPPMPLDS